MQSTSTLTSNHPRIGRTRPAGSPVVGALSSGRGLFLLAAGLVSTAGVANAQNVTWGTPATITGVADISTVGTYVDAMNFAGAPGGSYGANYTVMTVGSTTFHASTYGTVATPPAGFSDVGANQHLASDGYNISADIFGSLRTGNSGAGGSNFTAASPSSAAYSSVISNAAFLDSTQGTKQSSFITLSGLNVGDTYQVQIWDFFLQTGENNTTFFTGGGNTVDLNPNLGTSTAGGQYVLGTFVPTSTSYTLAFGYGGIAGATQDSAIVNDLALRDLTTPIPEPMSAMLAASLGSLVTLRRRH